MSIDFESVVKEIIRRPLTPLPQETQKIGGSSATWFSPEPRVAVVFTHGGSSEDRVLARKIASSQLESFGFEVASFTLDGSEDPEFVSGFNKQASWGDIMQKAKRLVQSGNVQVTKNTKNVVMSHVKGDNGNYECEIYRDDPNSRSITEWSCTCPWAQYAWQRTRKWKKYEGRVCAHVLATQWRSQSMPLDEEIDPNIKPVDPGGLQGVPDPAVMSPSLPGAEGESIDSGPPVEESAPQDRPMVGPVTPYAGPPETSGPDILPQFPGAPQPEPSVSVPGAVGPTPGNPIQMPASPTPGPYGGGTYSSVEQPDGFENGNMVQLLKTDIGIAEGKSKAHGSGQWREVQGGSIGEVMGQDPTTGMIEVIYPLNDSGPLEPFHVRMYHFPSEVKLRPDVARPGPFRKRR